MDYEQLYYDSQYEIKKLKREIEMLRDIISETNKNKTQKNIDLQKYLIREIKRFTGGKDEL